MDSTQTRVSDDGEAIAVSFIIPAYNEAKRLPHTLRQMIAFGEELDLPYEIIVVDDGSIDSTADFVRKLLPERRMLRLIENPHSGKAYTLRTGFLNACGYFSLQVDADLSTPPSELRKIIAFLQSGADVVLGVRSGRPGAPWYRRVMSSIWGLLVSTLLGLGLKDTQCGFKGYRTEVVQAALGQARLYSTPAASLRNARANAASDVEVLYLIQRWGGKIVEVPILWKHAGETKINPMRDSVEAFLDLLRIRWYGMRGGYETLPVSAEGKH